MKYTEKISTYWPEFGQNGKENITVADLMRHEAGLPIFHPHLLHVEDTLTGEPGDSYYVVVSTSSKTKATYLKIFHV